MVDTDKIKELVKRLEQEVKQGKREDALETLDEIHKEAEQDKEKCRLVSPNDIFENAKKMVIGGQEPKTLRDWDLIVNFFAFNIEDGCELPAIRVLKKLYSIPLTDESIEKIVKFQVDVKRREKRKHN